jgi:hypothetical protein
MSIKVQPSTAADILADAAETYRQRNAIYGDNFRRVAPIMALLLPAGAPPEMLHTQHFHLFELLIVKLTRFANSGLTHQDSIRDAAVYAAMIEASLLENENK